MSTNNEPNRQTKIEPDLARKLDGEVVADLEPRNDGSTKVRGGGHYTAVSDARLKLAVETFESALDRLRALNLG